MLSLPVLIDHPDFRSFASESHPLRPSKVYKFLACPMSAVLTMHEDSPGGAAAQTGNIIHDGVEAYHKAKGDRVAAGLAALAAAREQFPQGDPAKAERVFQSYAADKTNQDAVVTHCEAPVVLRIAPSPIDPTGRPVVIAGTLDQIRFHSTGKFAGTYRVWDVKTGDRLDSTEIVDDHLIQQAIYVMAARQTFGLDVLPGGLIHTPGYEKTRGKVHLPLPLTLEYATILCGAVAHQVALVRLGVAGFVPSLESCRYCPVKPWPNCVEQAKGVYGVSLIREV